MSLSQQAMEIITREQEEQEARKRQQNDTYGAEVAHMLASLTGRTCQYLETMEGHHLIKSTNGHVYTTRHYFYRLQLDDVVVWCSGPPGTDHRVFVERQCQHCSGVAVVGYVRPGNTAAGEQGAYLRSDVPPDSVDHTRDLLIRRIGEFLTVPPLCWTCRAGLESPCSRCGSSTTTLIRRP